MVFISENVGYLMSDDDFKTIDGGKTWTTVYDWNNQAGDFVLIQALLQIVLYLRMLVT